MLACSWRCLSSETPQQLSLAGTWGAVTSSKERAHGTVYGGHRRDAVTHGCYTQWILARWATFRNSGSPVTIAAGSSTAQASTKQSAYEMLNSALNSAA